VDPTLPYPLPCYGPLTPKALPQPLSVVLEMEQPELEAFLTAIFKSISGATAVAEKVREAPIVAPPCVCVPVDSCPLPPSVQPLSVQAG